MKPQSGKESAQVSGQVEDGKESLPQPASLLESVVERSAALPERVDGIAVGVLRSLDQVAACVDIPALGITHLPARSLVALGSAWLDKEVALGFEGGNPLQPFILGPVLAAPLNTVQAVVDGQRLELNASQEIELRCGDAAITLNADGRILLRGTYITSHASATQRILGGSVNVN